MRDPFAYSFRFCCDPGFNDEAEIAALDRYVDEALVDDVAVFANVEELNTGHMSYEEQDAYLTMMARIRAMLAPRGVSLSVNQWHSVMHADLGKALRPHQPFRPMVDGEGRAAALCVCPLCEAWQDYIGGLYARYARLEPAILWVEDDFRLHNHEPLAWGGCFCEEHMKLYSQRAGKPLTREEFLAGVLRPGEPHPYRAIWLDVSRETMLRAAEAIARAVRRVNRQARIGLMSSTPQAHAAEGRDWHALLRTLAAGQPPVDRVHLPGYQEKAPGDYLNGFNMVAMLTRAMLPPGTQVFPELENFPYGLFSKSRRFTRFQLLSALALDIRGITIDLYDLNGNGIVWEEGYQRMLRDTKPWLNALNGAGVFGGRRRGVQVLYSQRSAYTLHTEAGQSLEELYPQDCFWAGLLPALGVPFAFCDDPDSLTGQVVAASGQVLRNWDEATLERLFAGNFVLLNGDALATLADRGLARLAGVESLRWMRQGSGEYAYEEATDGRIYAGRPRARASAVIFASDALAVTYAPGAAVEEHSAFFDSFRRRAAPAQVVVEGRVLVYPFGRFGGPLALPPMLFNAMRRDLLHQVLQAARAPFPLVRGAAWLEPYCFETAEGGLAVYLVNGSADEQAAALAWPAGAPNGAARAWRSWEGAAPSPLPAGEALALPGLEAALLEFDTTTDKGE